MKAAVIPLAAVMALSACKAGVDLTVFTSDIVAVATKGEKLEALAIISLEAASQEKCLEARTDFQSALETGFSKVDFVACRSAGMDTWADFRVPVPIIQVGTEFTEPLAIGTDQQDGLIVAMLFQNHAATARIIAALPERMRDFVSGPLDPLVSVTVQNDMAGAAQITAQGMFVDGEPFQLPVTREVARRAELRLVLSNVGNAALNGADNGSLLFNMRAP